MRFTINRNHALAADIERAYFASLAEIVCSQLFRSFQGEWVLQRNDGADDGAVGLIIEIRKMEIFFLFE